MEKKLYHKRWREIRESIKERADHRCEECGLEEGTIMISRHTGRRYILYLHAAHTGKNPKDIRKSQLRALCPSCHMKQDRAQESQERRSEGKPLSQRRRGYQLTTTDKLIKAMRVAGLDIIETELGYDWQVDGLEGHATSAVNAVADAIYHLRQQQEAL